MTHRSRNGGPSKNHKKGASAAAARSRKLHHPPPPASATDPADNQADRTLLCPPELLSDPTDQHILDTIYAALRPTLASPVFPAVVQRIKALLYDSKWLEVFTDKRLLRAYAGRWVPSRALCFRELFGCFDEVVGVVRDGGHVLSLGGGAGSELLALAALRQALLGMVGDGPNAAGGEGDGAEDEEDEENEEEEEDDDGSSDGDGERSTPPPHTPPSLSIRWTGADIGAWDDVLETLGTQAESTWASGINRHYFQGDLLESAPQQHQSDESPPSPSASTDSTPPSPSGIPAMWSHLSQHPPRLITLLFTLTELLSQSPQRTIALLSRLTDATAPGALLLVADSASDIASFALGAGGREWPTYTIIDMVLLRMLIGASDEPAAAAGARWELLSESDSRWYRLQQGVGATWPVKLENTRYWYRLYRRL